MWTHLFEINRLQIHSVRSEILVETIEKEIFRSVRCDTDQLCANKYGMSCDIKRTMLCTYGTYKSFKTVSTDI